MSTTKAKDYLNQIYDAQINSEKEQLTQAYNESAAQLDADQEAAEQQKQKNLVATNVEAQKAQRNYAEVQNAVGLTSGAMAQARLAQDNQLQADMTAIRAAHQDADAEIERQRSLLAQQYSAAIREAQANNDLARAQALYELAREEDAKLLARRQASGTTVDAPSQTPSVPMPLPAAAQDIVYNAPSVLGGSLTLGLRNPPKAPANTSGSTGSSIGSSHFSVDMSSLGAIGYANISGAKLDELIRSGAVEEYVENGVIKFRRKSSGSSGSGLRSADTGNKGNAMLRR